MSDVFSCSRDGRAPEPPYTVSPAYDRCDRDDTARVVAASHSRHVMLRALLGWAQRADWRRFQRAITRLAAGALQSATQRRIVIGWLQLVMGTQVPRNSHAELVPAMFMPSPAT